ncbi:MAG: hypothetical protein QM754_18190 [Tepidisphaeraceae bacterium]
MTEPMTYRGARVAPLDDWLMPSAIWPRADELEGDDLKTFHEGVQFCIEKAWERRLRQRSYAKRNGKPIPELTDELVPLFLDFVGWPRRKQEPSSQPAKKVLLPEFLRERHYVDPDPEGTRKRREELEAKYRALAEQERERKAVLQRLYAERAKARKLGLPVPPTPSELRAAADGNQRPPQWYPYRPSL